MIDIVENKIRKLSRIIDTELTSILKTGKEEQRLP
jgi:hypothetical protein